MLPLFALIPLAASVVLGVVYLLLGEARPRNKMLGSAVFVVAVYLQFFSRHVLIGLLLQIALAVSLAIWRRFDSAV